MAVAPGAVWKGECDQWMDTRGDIFPGPCVASLLRRPFRTSGGVNADAGDPSTESRHRRKFQSTLRKLELLLDDFDPDVRAATLGKLALLEVPGEDFHGRVNMHMHTFFSYHAEGWSPSRFAWEVRKAGLWAAGIIDFDGVDGIDEFLNAAESLCIRASAGIEVRTFLSGFAEVEIDSPGQPGVHHIVGAGFARPPKPGTSGAEYLARLRGFSERRTRAMAARFNAALPSIAVDLEPFARVRTPSGYTGERHLAAAYIERAEAVFSEPVKRADFWSGILGRPRSAVLALLPDRRAFAEAVLGMLMKADGIGSLRPDRAVFPPTGEVYAWMRSCGAIPTDSWPGGTSAGEARARELLECNRGLGARALSLIPDRSRNAKDPMEKRRKLENLARVVALAAEWRMPLLIGTEGCKTGSPFADDLVCPELSPYKAGFLEGAGILVGHAILARYADYEYCGEAAEAEFGGDIRAKNGFFASVGNLPPLNADLARRLKDLGPASALAALRASSRRGVWTGLNSLS